MPQIVEDYQSRTASVPADGFVVSSNQSAVITNNPDSRLGVWVSNATPNSYCWLRLDGQGDAVKYQGIYVAPGTTFFTNLYLGGISANAGINPLPLSNAEVLHVTDYGLDGNYLQLTFEYPHNIPRLVESPGDPEGTPITNEVRVYGTERGAFNIQAPIYSVPDQYTIIMRAFYFITLGAVDNEDGTWTIQSNFPHRFDNDGQSYFISNGSEYNIDTSIDPTHYTITSGSPITGTIWPAPGFVSGWAQDAQPVRLGVVEI